ncbi:DUF3313 domain-containing protein [Thalassotalea euphylliae]|uniref:DUF3313 domain-containing protein n=1 Tax=Thalassotalea euphylliae TaxID=1655234 RepID=UPI00362F94C6
MKFVKTALASISLVALLSACGSTQPEEKEVKHSGFLSDYSQMKVVDKDDDSINYVYDSTIDRSKYKKVIIESIDYYPKAPTSKQMSDKVKKEIEQFVEKNMTTIVGKKYEITDQKGPDTFVLRSAITGLTIDDKELSAYQYIPIAFLVTAASGGLSDMSVKIKIEAEALDSESGKVITSFTKLDAGETLAGEDTQLEFKHVEPLLTKWFKALDTRVNQ